MKCGSQNSQSHQTIDCIRSQYCTCPLLNSHDLSGTNQEGGESVWMGGRPEVSARANETWALILWVRKKQLWGVSIIKLFSASPNVAKNFLWRLFLPLSVVAWEMEVFHLFDLFDYELLTCILSVLISCFLYNISLAFSKLVPKMLIYF